MAVHNEIEKQLPESITTNDEMDILAIEADTTLANKLIALGKVHAKSASLSTRAMEAQQKMDEHSAKSFSTVIQELTDEHSNSIS